MSTPWPASFHDDELLCELREGILLLTIHRPDSYNAWTSALRDELAICLNMAEADPAIDGLVLTGSGEQAFCAGQDLSELETFIGGDGLAAWFARLTSCYDAIRAFTKPLVAAVNGVAAGSGFQVTQFCDLVVAHPGVRLGQTEVNSGLPSVFGTWLMWERVGRRAVELALQGRLMTAAEAHAMGFVHHVVKPQEVLGTALDAARRLANQPRVAFKYSKLANRAFDAQGYAGAMQLALEYYREAFDTGAPQEEIVRFFERRAARKAAGASSLIGFTADN